MDRETRDEVRTLIRRLIEEPGDTFDPRDADRLRALISKPRSWLKRTFGFELSPIEAGRWHLDWLGSRCLELRRISPRSDRRQNSEFEVWHICFEEDQPTSIMREETAVKEYRLWRWKIRRRMRRMFPRKRPAESRGSRILDEKAQPKLG